MAYECPTCKEPFIVLSRVRGFATIPAKLEKLACESCGKEYDLYQWWPPIRERNACAILTKEGS